MKIDFPKNITKKKIVINQGIARSITRYYWGWWNELIPIGTYSCFLENGKLCWKEGNFPFIEKEKVWLDSNGVIFSKKYYEK